MPGDSRASRTAREGLDESLSAEDRRWEEAKLFDKDNTAFYAEINAFLRRLQDKGRIAGSTPNELNFAPVDPLPSTRPGTVYSFAFGRPQAVAFTLWWRDDDEPQDQQREPKSTDLRVRVQAQAALDHATISIYIDAGKPWGEEYLVRGTPSFDGVRRHRIVRHVQAIRDLTDAQLAKGLVDLDMLPEAGVDRDAAQKLSDAADYLYKGIWDEFIASFGLTLWPDKKTGEGSPAGHRFSESRGLLISINGTRSPAEDARLRQTADLRKRIVTDRDGVQGPPSEGTIGIGEFPIFDAASGEPNSVIKSLLPFLRRSHVKLDQRELVACGILDWRALFLTTLGSTANADAREESSGPDWEAPGGHLPDAKSVRDMGTENRPNRHLFVTKGEPHRMQIGRFIERVNAAECLRLFALKNWATIQNASVHIRLLDRELDGVLSNWSAKRLEIDSRLSAMRKTQLTNTDPRERDRIDDALTGLHAEELYDLIVTTESRLISIAAALDRIGQDGAGRLLYLLSRSGQFTLEFERLMSMIDVGNVPTWLNYKNFVRRGLRSTFDAIEATQDRMISLRGRIQTITDVVQTSALIIEAEATKQNTRELRLMARNYTALRTTTYIAVATMIMQFIALVAGPPAIAEFFDDAWTWVSGFF